MSLVDAQQPAPQSLLNGNQAPHVVIDDVDSFLRMMEQGLIPAEMNNCAAVQDNISLRHDTRVELTM